MTKWTKKALVILLSIAVITCLFALTACAHQHEWASEWSKDETNHWHECLDEECQEKGDLAEHAWNAGEITTPATEEATGIKTFTCTECGQTKTEEVAKLNHTHSWATELSKDETGHWYACTKAGCDGKNGFEAHNYHATYQKSDTQHWKVCSDCDWEDTKADHIWDEGTVTTPPTGTSAGEKSVTCGICGKTATQAIPKLEQYTISFDADGGLPAPSSITVTFGDTIDASTLPVSAKEGFDLVGWYAQDDNDEYTIKLGVDMTTVGDLGEDGATLTVKAIWEIHRWTVSFNAGDGVEVADQLVTHGECAEFVEPNKEGAIFLHWELDGSEYNFATSITEDVELTAVYQEWTIEQYLPNSSTGVVDLSEGLVDDAEAMGGKAYKAVLTGSAVDTKGIVVSFGEQGIDISDYAHVFIRIKIVNPEKITTCTLRAGVNAEPVAGSQGYPYYDPAEARSSDIWRHYFSYDLKELLASSENGILKSFYLARTAQAIGAGQIEIYIDHIDFVKDALVLENVTSVKNDVTGNSYTVGETFSNKGVIQTLGASNMNDQGATFVGWDLDIYTGKYVFIGNFRQATNDVLSAGSESSRSLTLNFNNIDLTQYEHVYIKIKSLNTDTTYPANCNVFLGINGYTVSKSTPEKDWNATDVASGAMYKGYFVYDILAIENCPAVLTSLSIFRSGAVNGYQYGIMFYIESIEFVVKADHTHASETYLFSDDYSEQYKLCDYCGAEFDRASHQHTSDEQIHFVGEDYTKEYNQCTVCEQFINEKTHQHTSDEQVHFVNNNYEYEYNKCTVCEQYINEVAHQHSNSTTATCLAKAVCGVCGQEHGELAAHNFGEVSYVWTADYTKCTATRVCSLNDSHKETETVNSVKVVTQEANPSQDELSKFTATFTNPAFAEQVKENIVTGSAQVLNYTIKFDADGGEAVDAAQVKFGDTISVDGLPTTTKAGHTFLGWYVQDDQGAYTVKLGVDLTTIPNLGPDGTEYTVKAKWEINSLEVSFDAGDGIEIASQTVEYGQKATQPDDPNKEGAIFIGWEVDGSAFDFATPITEDIEISAKFVEYTISKWGTEADVTLTGLIDDKDAYGQTYEAKLLSSGNTTSGIKISFGAEGIDVSDYAHVFIRLKIHNPTAITTCTSAISVNHEPTTADKGYPYKDPTNNGRTDDVWRGYFSYDLKELMTATDNGILKEVYIARIAGGTDKGLYFYVDHIDFVEEALILENVTSINGGQSGSYTVPTDGAYSNKSLLALTKTNTDKAIILGWDMDPHTGNYAFVGNFSVNGATVTEGSDRAITLNFADIDLTQYEHVYVKIKNYNADGSVAANCTVQMSINGTTIKQGIPGTDWGKVNYPENSEWVEGSANVYEGYFVYDLKAMTDCPETLSSLALWRSGAVQGSADGIMIYIESIEFVPV